MEKTQLNIIGKKSDFLKDIPTKPIKIVRPTCPHDYGCQCEDCESFLYYNLELSRA